MTPRWLFLVLVLAVASGAQGAKQRGTRDLFEDFKNEHNKTYSSADEEIRRFEAFEASLRRQEGLRQRERAANAGRGLHPLHDAVFGITRFSDLSPEEFAARYLRTNVSPSSVAETEAHRYNTTQQPHLQHPRWRRDVPKSFDWRTQVPAVVTPVKNQEQCGGCWAVSTAETLESAWALRGAHPLVELSFQQMISCQGDGNSGCDGGDAFLACNLLLSGGGLEAESMYPFVNQDGGTAPPCLFDESRVVAKPSSCNRVSSESDMLVALLNHGPLSVSVDAHVWQDYVGGIIRHHCGTSLNHAVAVVGYEYDAASSQTAYIVRNSWGTEWGLEGYILVEAGVNMCGIAQQPYFMTV